VYMLGPPMICRLLLIPLIVLCVAVVAAAALFAPWEFAIEQPAFLFPLLAALAVLLFACLITTAVFVVRTPTLAKVAPLTSDVSETESATFVVDAEEEKLLAGNQSHSKNDTAVCMDNTDKDAPPTYMSDTGAVVIHPEMLHPSKEEFAVSSLPNCASTLGCVSDDTGPATTLAIGQRVVSPSEWQMPDRISALSFSPLSYCHAGYDEDEYYAR